MDLGRALVKQLEREQVDDILSFWMAHYIAELIEATETAKREDRPVQLAKCANAILSLWEHRHQLPDGKRPFEDFEPILRAIESLDLNSKTPRYFRSARMAVDETKENAETKKWLEIVDGVDYTAKILIRYCLTQAAQTALDKSKEWIRLAEVAGLEDGADLPTIRVVIVENYLTKTSKPADSARKLLEDRIKRLEAFKEMAESLVFDMRQQLKGDET